MSLLSRLLGVKAPEPGPPDPVSPSAPPNEEAFRAQVEAVLESIRPALAADGGDVQLVSVSGRSATVRLTGACQGCHSAALTLRLGIEKRLRDAIPGFEDLIPV